MNNLTRRPVKRTAVGILAGTLAFSGAALGVGVSPANALPQFDFDRLAGNDRYGTAASIAANTFVNGAQNVVLASGNTDNPSTTANESRFPDALAGNYLAGALNGPILLTDSDELPNVTVEALETLEAESITIVGGETAVSADVADELEELGYDVQRIGGATRYDTAAELVRQVAVGTDDDAPTGTVGELDGQRIAILGNGQNFPDILAAGPLSYAEQFPITITPNTGEGLDDRTAAVLEDAEIDKVIIVGGTSAVTASAEEEAEEITGSDAIRLEGTQRFQTAVAIAEFALAELGFDESHVDLARSDDFADALSGGPHAGVERAPIVITTPDVLHPATEAYLNAHACALTDGHIFGGFVAVSPEVAEQAEDAAQSNENCPAPDPVLQVEPDTNEDRIAQADTVTEDGTTQDDSTFDDRTYEVSGLDEGETYRVTLVRCDLVTFDEDGNAIFTAVEDANSSTGFGAATGQDNATAANELAADLLSVNGEAIAADSTTATFLADSATSTFTIDGDRAGSVLPVVYFDSSTADEDEGGSIPRLEVNADGTPAEDYDTGGCTTFFEADDTNGPNIADADVATDSTTATLTADGELASDTATSTATAGDVLELLFNEPIATPTDGASFGVTDEDGDITVIECGIAGIAGGNGVTAATCELSQGGTLLTITLLEDGDDNNLAPGNGGNDGLQYSLSILGTSGLVDVDGNAVDLNNSDTLIEVNDDTQFVAEA